MDFHGCFSPIAKWTIIGTLIHSVAVNQWLLHHIDINNALLHGYLQEEIYLKPPEVYDKALPSQVCRLDKSLYGLKQESREWNAEFIMKLLNFGFVQSEHDHCLFTGTTQREFTAIVVYVDDVLLVQSSIELIDELKKFLHKAFTIKDLGTAKYF